MPVEVGITGHHHCMNMTLVIGLIIFCCVLTILLIHLPIIILNMVKVFAVWRSR